MADYLITLQAVAETPSQVDRKDIRHMAEENVEKKPKEAKDTRKVSKELEETRKALEESRKALEESQKALEEAKAATAKEKDDYLRLMAEFENFRRRNAQEKLELVSVAAKDTIEGLLPVLDDCERAMKALAASEDSQAAKEGTEMIYNKLMAYLKGKGLAAIDAIGQPFDTDMHEAVAQFPVEDEEKKGKVFDVCLTGYTLNGKVIRFAKVVVGI